MNLKQQIESTSIADNMRGLGKIMDTHVIPSDCVDGLKHMTKKKHLSCFHIPIGEVAEAYLAAHGYVDGFHGENDFARNMYLAELNHVQSTFEHAKEPTE